MKKVIEFSPENRYLIVEPGTYQPGSAGDCRQFDPNGILNPHKILPSV
jgi:hypothetical protein